ITRHAPGLLAGFPSVADFTRVSSDRLGAPNLDLHLQDGRLVSAAYTDPVRFAPARGASPLVAVIARHLLLMVFLSRSAGRKLPSSLVLLCRQFPPSLDNRSGRSFHWPLVCSHFRDSRPHPSARWSRSSLSRFLLGLRAL